jgi:hypothetical protein
VSVHLAGVSRCGVTMYVNYAGKGGKLWNARGVNLGYGNRLVISTLLMQS